MLDDYKEIQPVVYHILKNAVLKNRNSHAYLFETKGYPKQLDVALAFSKFLLCPRKNTAKNNCGTCTQCSRIDDGNFTELKIIEPDGLWIKKEQLEELQSEFSKKSIEAKIKVYIINHAEKLNAAAANSILKFLEEPEENIVAILLTDNLYQLLNTIVSRCQIISFSNPFVKKMEKEYQIENKTLFHIGNLLMDNETALLNFIHDAKNVERIEAVIKFVKYYEKNGKEILLHMNSLWFTIFKDKESFLQAFEIMTYIYKDCLNFLLDRPIEIMENYFEDIKLIASKNDIISIRNKIAILLEEQNDLKINANLNLLMDKLILSFERGKIR